MRTVCAVGTVEGEEVPRLSMASGIMDFKKLLQEMVKGIESNPNVKLEDYPNIHKTLARWVLVIIFLEVVTKEIEQ